VYKTIPLYWWKALIWTAKYITQWLFQFGSGNTGHIFYLIQTYIRYSLSSGSSSEPCHLQILEVLRNFEADILDYSQGIVHIQLALGCNIAVAPKTYSKKQADCHSVPLKNKPYLNQKIFWFVFMCPASVMIEDEVLSYAEYFRVLLKETL
jgi:hypothetical protein